MCFIKPCILLIDAAVHVCISGLIHYRQFLIDLREYQHDEDWRDSYAINVP